MAQKIQSRQHDMLGTPVLRMLPHRSCRAVGPFVFLDHFGPSELSMQVAPHPHVGLSTLTWLLTGTIRHADSLGNDLWIRPGEVNWMTAGNGIVHAERSHDEPEVPIEGLQCWVAQTIEHEQGQPGFQHLDANELPRFSREGIDWTLVVGHWMEERSPLSINWPTFFVEGLALTDGIWRWPYPACWALGIYVIEGEARVRAREGDNWTRLTRGELAVLPPPTGQDVAYPQVTMTGDTRFVCLGGEPLPEPRYFDWNFVASDRKLLEQARADWIADRRFGKVPGDDERIPHPAE